MNLILVEDKVTQWLLSGKKVRKIAERLKDSGDMTVLIISCIFLATAGSHLSRMMAMQNYLTLLLLSSTSVT